MKNEDEIGWYFEERNEVVYLKKDVRVDKYTFHKTNPPFDENAYREEHQKASNENRPPPRAPHLSVYVSWRVESDKTDTLMKKYQGEMDEILNLLTLQTRHVLYRGQFNHEPQGAGGVGAIVSSVRLKPQIKELEESDIVEAVKFKQKISTFGNEKKELLSRSIDWYARGNSENDLENALANHRIGFESLSYWFGLGLPWFCPNCKKKLQDSSINQRLKLFVEKLGMSQEKELVGKLYKTRNYLFHRAQSSLMEDRNNLRELLKNVF